MIFSKSLTSVLLACCLVLGVGLNSVSAQPSDDPAKEETVDSYEKLKVFSEILSLLEANYVENLDTNDLIDGAIRGMLKTLDPHTSYLPPESFKQMKVETSGRFGGLGIEITLRKGILTVVTPIEDTPAFKAGVKSGDRIIKIEDESTLDMTLSDAVEKLRGEIGTEVTITVFREGMEEPIIFTLARGNIQVKSVKSKIYEGGIGYVKIRSFTKTTSSDLDKALAEFKAKQVKKLVLDLRNNPGGLLNQAVEVSDRFLNPENLIVYTQGRTDEQNMRFTTHDNVQRVSYPMIILVNGGSASASEIVAGALQDSSRAIILGTQTFGKGSVQTIIPLSDGSALRLTTARYYTPSGRVIQENGIIPDIIVEVPLVQASASDDEEKDKEEDDKEKVKMRKFLREKDLKKHLKGKKSFGEENLKLNEETKSEEEIKNQEILASLREDLEKDVQLKEAIDLLKGWSVMSKVFNPNKANN
ncbi:MAG: S41 family peptidase [Nitrospinota bacterium]|nr:S41 family peptidase [Nitrospinota bacterium]